MSPFVTLLKRLDKVILLQERPGERVAAKNTLVSTWLDEMELRCRDAEATEWIPSVDKIDSINLENFEMLNGGTFSTPLKIDDCPTSRTVFDIKTYEMAYEYAMFAVMTHNMNEDDKAHLENVLWGCKCKVNNDWIYRLILEATNGEKELDSYYAIIKVGPDKHFELINWFLLRRTFFNSDGEEEVRRNIVRRSKYWAMACSVESINL